MSDPAFYGDTWARIYDEVFTHLDPAAAVEVLAELGRHGPCSSPDRCGAFSPSSTGGEARAFEEVTMDKKIIKETMLSLEGAVLESDRQKYFDYVAGARLDRTKPIERDEQAHAEIAGELSEAGASGRCCRAHDRHPPDRTAAPVTVVSAR
jgi:hypothetical protein